FELLLSPWLIALLEQSHSEMIVERRIVRLLRGQFPENLNGVVAQALLDIDPSECVRDIRGVGQLLFGALSHGQVRVQIGTLFGLYISQIIQRDGVVRLDFENLLVERLGLIAPS